MAKHNGWIADAEGSSGPDKFQVPGPEKLSPNHADKSHPGKEQQQAEQPPEVRLDHAGENNQEIQKWHTRPGFDEALEQEVYPAAKVALYGCRRHANYGA